MSILFTGASSFTGFSFVQELLHLGYPVTACFQKELREYSGIRRERIDILLPHVRPLFNCSFGSPDFIELLKKNTFDLLCHHGHTVENYKSTDFDAVKAVHNNCYNHKEVLRLLKEKGTTRLILTGTVFENGTLQEISPYSLSKRWTSDLFELETHLQGLHFAKFVIPHPFGPYEEERLTTSCVKKWLRGESSTLLSPNYIRDNIPITLLAKAYGHFVRKKEMRHFAPSGTIGSMEEFMKRFGRELQKRLQLPCELQVEKQVAFSEPRIRVNTDFIDKEALQFSESQFWDELATYYERFK